MEEADQPYPTCGDVRPAAGHGSFEPIPPVAAGATVTVEVQPFFEATAESFICASLDYIDARGEHRITDWIWARRETSSESEIWVPIDIHLFEDTVPEWWVVPPAGPVEE